MKRHGLAVIAALTINSGVIRPVAMVAATAVVAGCASQTPTQRLFATRGTATIIVRDLNLAVQAGKISEKDHREILNPLIQQADKIFDQWEAAVNSGQPGAVDYAALVQSLLNSIQQYLIAKEAQK